MKQNSKSAFKDFIADYNVLIFLVILLIVYIILGTSVIISDHLKVKELNSYEEVSYLKLFDELKQDGIVHEILVRKSPNVLIISYENETKIVKNIVTEQFIFDFQRYIKSNNQVIVIFEEM